MSQEFDDLMERVAALEEQLKTTPTDDARATSELQRALETSWQPDGDTFLLPHSVGVKSLEPFCFYQAALAGQTVLNQTITEMSSAATVEVDIVPTPNTTSTNASAAGNFRFTCPYSGMWLITGGIRWESNVVGTRLIGITVNGTNLNDSFYAQEVQASTSADETRNTISIPIQLGMGSSLSIWGYQNSGGPLATVTSRFSVLGLGPIYVGNFSNPKNPAKVMEP